MGVEQQEFGEDDDEICVLEERKEKLKNVYHHVLGNQENP